MRNSEEVQATGLSGPRVSDLKGEGRMRNSEEVQDQTRFSGNRAARFVLYADCSENSNSVAELLDARKVQYRVFKYRSQPGIYSLEPGTPWLQDLDSGTTYAGIGTIEEFVLSISAP
jgi:hypothetical protein